MAGRKKKVPTPRGNPRLKACSQCQVLNAPRTFFCKECNHPFYSEEYMAGRLDRKRSEPDGSESSVPPTPSIVAPDFFQVDEFAHRIKMMPELSSSYILSPHKVCSSINFDLFLGETDSTVPISIPHHSHYSLNEKFSDASLIAKESLFMNVGDPVDSISFNPTNTCLATLVCNHRLIFWDLVRNESIACFESPDAVIKSVSFCSNFSSSEILGILAVVKTDRVELLLVENFSLRLIFSTFDVFNDPLFPTDADCRFLNNSIEVLISNNLSSFVYLIRLDDGLRLSSFRSFGYNHVVNKVNIDDGSSSVVQSTCVSYLRASANFFLAGYSAGTIGLWDIRNQSSPVQIITNTAGTRRFLLGLKTSWNSPQTAFAAFQAGSTLDLDPADDQGEIVSIGGDIRSAQCFGIDCVGTRAFAAMSSGVVITIDSSLRGKLRRPLTSYICQWEAEADTPPCPNIIATTMSLEEKLISKMGTKKQNQKIHAKLFCPKKIPNNLKLLKASDGASNEGFTKLVSSESSVAVPIRCVVSSSDGLVAYGNDVGIVHIFRP